jgi:hypothetical protein
VFNPLPSLMLQSAWDSNVPCRPKRSKVLLLSYTFKCPLKRMQSFCRCSRALNRSGKGLKWSSIQGQYIEFSLNTGLSHFIEHWIVTFYWTLDCHISFHKFGWIVSSYFNCLPC